MKDKAIAGLRLDKRLARREGWIEVDELQRELDTLPDVSQKATTLDGSGSEAGAGAPSDAPAGSEGAGSH